MVGEQLLHLHRCFNIFISIRTVSFTEHSQEWTKIIITFGPYWNGILLYLGGYQS